MTLGPFRDNTPGDSLEVLFDIIPLDLFILGESRKAKYRLKPNFDYDWSGQGQGKRLGHIRQAKMDEREMGITQITCDKINRLPIWEKDYEVLDFGIGEDRYQGYRCYTDGSKTRNGVGSGLCVMMHGHIMKTRCYGLNDFCTVFQAEIYAIKRACEILTDMKDGLANDPEFGTIRILSDSQAALLALDKVDTESQLVLDTKLALNRLGKALKVQLGWIKAHVNYKGNEMADTLAKTGIRVNQSELIGPSRAAINAQITSHIYDKWNERWVSNNNHRQSKKFMPDVYQRGRAKLARGLSRQDTGILVRNITGHAFLQRHNNIIKNGYTAPVPNEIDDEFMNHISNTGTDGIRDPGPLAEVDLEQPG